MKKAPAPAQEDSLPKIGAPATRALAGIGITRLRQLTRVSRAELAELHGMGPKALGILEKALADEELAFRAPGADDP